MPSVPATSTELSDMARSASICVRWMRSLSPLWFAFALLMIVVETLR